MTGEAPAATAMAPPHPGLEFVEADDRLSIAGPGGLRLTFRRLGDRWDHALGLGVGDDLEADPFVWSLEGDPARDDPARVVSPAFQDASRHPRDDGICLLLTGQSARHHYSGVVLVRIVGDSLTIDVDVADRCREPIAVLASTYTVRLGAGALLDAGPSAIAWGDEALGGGRLELLAGEPGTVALAEAGRGATRVQALARIDPATSTQRLVYRWRWTPPH